MTKPEKIEVQVLSREEAETEMAINAQRRVMRTVQKRIPYQTRIEPTADFSEMVSVPSNFEAIMRGSILAVTAVALLSEALGVQVPKVLPEPPPRRIAEGACKPKRHGKKPKRRVER